MLRGYEADQFTDAFVRYIPLPRFQTVTVLQPAPVKDLRDFQSVTRREDVTLEKQREAVPVKDCNIVTVENTLREDRGNSLREVEL